MDPGIENCQHVLQYINIVTRGWTGRCLPAVTICAILVHPAQ